MGTLESFRMGVRRRRGCVICDRQDDIEVRVFIFHVELGQSSTAVPLNFTGKHIQHKEMVLA